MMMRKLKNVLPLIAFVVGLSLVFSQSAFKFGDKKTTTLKYRYNGPDEAGLTTLINWEDVSEQEEPENCLPGTEIPCLVEFEDNEYDDIVDFYTTNDTAVEMFDTHKVVSKKNEN
jgi:hypothetical protein